MDLAGLVTVDAADLVLALDAHAELLFAVSSAAAAGHPLSALLPTAETARRPDGTIVAVRSHESVLAVDGRAVRVHVVTAGADAAVRLASVEADLREKEVLLKEIHHRVKNNLQVTSSLLKLQSARVDDPRVKQMLRDSQDRIRSMALAHEMLYRSRDLSTVDFAEYARDLIAHLARAHGSSARQVKLAVGVEQCFLGLDVAVPLGLIVNELATNALKHAFPGERAGEIAVRLRSASDSTYELTVADDGVGMPPGVRVESGAPVKSLGLQLVVTLTEQLEGHLDVQSDAGDGTEFRIAFPRRT